MSAPNTSFNVPYRQILTSSSGVLTRPWEWFFRDLWERLYALGIEKSFNIENDQSTAADVTGLKFDKRGVSVAFVEFAVQRITTGTGATELLEAGLFAVVYKPTSEDWAINLIDINKPDNSGVDFTVTSDGQVQYTSSSITGTASISRVTWRARTFRAKSSQYSGVGAR